jgi:hypothetical protein
VTCDGPATHLKMFELLGVSYKIDNFVSSFDLNNQKVYFMLDGCHMMKVMQTFYLILEYCMTLMDMQMTNR